MPTAFLAPYVSSLELPILQFSTEGLDYLDYARSTAKSLNRREDKCDMESAGKRPSRPPYGEQQKFFIAYMRIIKHKSWAQIGEEYAICFPEDTSPRSKGGLTSVYYRVRKEW
ncbi:hypothetical protein D0868_04637 [Hortaea werneckii]|uniref:Uncharacterized protein n=1 Tax=Hortaea werneckii TaxID=91943 RepID=A0A3M6Z093_HORWE|nr:hypothetical protein D0868_04637 [Hortaea werneckii]